MDNTIIQEKPIDEIYGNLKAIIIALDQDYEKFKSKKIKVAGARVRNTLLHCKKLCDMLRKQLLTQINKLPVKHRSKSSDEFDVSNKSEVPLGTSISSGSEEDTMETPLSEREMMEHSGEIPPVITKTKRKPRRANKKKEKKEEKKET